MNHFLISLWKNFINSGIASDKFSSSEVYRINLVNIFSVIGGASFFIFGLYHLSFDSRLIGYNEIGAGIVTLLNLLILRKTKSVALSSSVVLLVMLYMLSVLFISGGIGDTGILWFYTLPALAFFLKSRHEGLIWMIVFGLILGVIKFLEGQNVLETAYDSLTFRQMIISLSVVSVLVYFYEMVNEKTSRTVISQKSALVKANKELREKIKLEKMSEIQLNKNNKSLEDSKKAMLNILEDLDDEKDKLVAAKAKDDAILAGIGEGLVTTDNKGRIIFVNKSFTDILGWTEKEVKTKKLTQVVRMENEKGQSIKSQDRLINKTLVNKVKTSTSIHTMYYVSKSGQRVPVALTVSPVIIHDEIIGAVAVFRDISREKDVDKMKTEFVSVASHQLRTPLSAIKWFLEMILDGDAGKVNKEQKEFLQQAFDSNERMIVLVNDLLNVSRLEAGRLAVKPELTNIESLSKSILKEFSPMIDSHNVSLKAKYQKNLPKIKIDKKLITQVIVNLVSNAIKYTPEKGSITYSVEVKDKNMLFTVKDTGIGIPKNQQEKVFNKFFRSDISVEKETEGTGLGLYVAKSIIKSSGGDIGFKSTEGKGTKFWFTIPLSGSKAVSGDRDLEQTKV